MRKVLLAVCTLIACVDRASATGLLIPEDRKLPPLAMVSHRVKVDIQDQVAVTHLEQSFRNHTDRPLEATYVFPVPRGASVNQFAMTVDGKEVAGEMVEAAKARQVYTDIVRRTQDPGLLEYVGNNLFRVRVFPVPPQKDQKITLRFTSIAPQDAGLVEYVYPLKTDGKATRTLEDFSVKVEIKSQRSVLNVYSPTHAIESRRTSQHAVEVTFSRDQATLDKDFQLFVAVGTSDLGFTPITYRPVSTEDGYFLFLISPNLEVSRSEVLPRDLVLVLDTSGSMAGAKMDQARRAARLCLDSLNPQDRFAVCHFSTTVGKYRDALVESTKEQVDNAKRWVDGLRTSGGTAIDDALAAALSFRSNESGRTLTVIFFTDGLPTIGETNPEKILKKVAARTNADTRIFTFGVGDDVNAMLLDQLAEQSRAISTYVRPAEDIEVKASALSTKTSQPVLTNLQLTASGGMRIAEMYPPHLPDLFQGGQVVVLGRYAGHGPAAVTLAGMIGAERRDFVYEMNLAPRDGENRDFVEHLWARRKIGFLLDQIRQNGEKKELIDEVTSVAKRYGIATPYTSYLIVPDAPVSVLSLGRGANGPAPASTAPALLGGRPAGGAGGIARTESVAEFARRAQAGAGDLAGRRDAYEDGRYRDGGAKGDTTTKQLAEAADKKVAMAQAKDRLAKKALDEVRSGKLGVDFALEAIALKTQSRLTPSAQRVVAGRSCLEIGGVWIDDGYQATMATLTIKAQSAAYFRLLERHPQLRDVYRLGNHVLWVTPSRTALVIDTTDGKEVVPDAEIDLLFVEKK